MSNEQNAHIHRLSEADRQHAARALLAISRDAKRALAKINGEPEFVLSNMFDNLFGGVV